MVICRAFLAIIRSSYTIFSNSLTLSLSTFNKKGVICATLRNIINQIVLHMLSFINAKKLMKIFHVGSFYYLSFSFFYMLPLLFFGLYLPVPEGLITHKAFDVFHSHVLEKVTAYSGQVCRWHKTGANS